MSKRAYLGQLLHFVEQLPKKATLGLLPLKVFNQTKVRKRQFQRIIQIDSKQFLVSEADFDFSKILSNLRLYIALLSSGRPAQLEDNDMEHGKSRNRTDKPSSSYQFEGMFNFAEHEHLTVSHFSNESSNFLQLQSNTQPNSGERDVKFQLAKDTLETMLSSMYSIRDQLTDPVSLSASSQELSQFIEMINFYPWIKLYICSMLKFSSCSAIILSE